MANVDYNALFFVPIEPQPYRYSAQWSDWFSEALDEYDDALTVHGIDPSGGHTFGVPEGKFEDVTSTNIYKARQQRLLAEHLPDAEAPTCVFFLDLWHPAVLTVAHLRDALDLDLDIKGILHAGTYDPWDQKAHKGMHAWGRPFEQAILGAADTICLGSEYHKGLLTDTFPRRGDTEMIVTGLPVFTDPHRRSQRTERRVVFPHRAAIEKDHMTFKKIKGLYAQRFPCDDAEWTRTVEEYTATMDARDKKERYYDILSTSRVALSTARQETFGIAMQEARNLGATPIVPDRLAYQDVIPSPSRYSSLGEAVQKIRGLLDHASNRALAPRFTEARAASILTTVLSK